MQLTRMCLTISLHFTLQVIVSSRGSGFSYFFVLGLADFSFMKRIRSVNDLKDRLLVEKFRYINKYIFNIWTNILIFQVSGKGGAGAGHCMWANEWEIGVVCRLCSNLTSITTYYRLCKRLKGTFSNCHSPPGLLA